MRVQPFIFRPLLEPTPMAVKAQPDLALVETPPAPETPPVVTYTEEDLARAKEAAYQEGKRDGEAAQQAQFDGEARQREEALQQVVREVDAKFVDWAQHYNAFLKTRCPDIARLVVVVAQKVAANALKDQPLAPLESMIAECMQSIADAPTMSIAVHPSLAEPLEHRLSAMARQNGYAGVCTVVPDPNLHLSDARIEWKNGFAERKMDDLWHHLDTLVNQVVTGLFAPMVTLEVKPSTALTNPSQDETNS